MSLVQVTGATITSGGSGGTNGTQTVTVVGGDVGAGGAAAQLSVTVSGGAITAILSVLNPGTYQGDRVPVNPVAVTGANLVGATLGLIFNTYGAEPDFLL